MDDLSHLAEGALTEMGSMAGTNTVSQPVKAFGAPGSRSESVLGSDVRPEADPVPPVAVDPHTAGVGDRGGIVHGEPGGNVAGAWSEPGGDIESGRWTRNRAVYDSGH